MPLFTAFLSSNSLKQNVDVKFYSKLCQLKALNFILCQEFDGREGGQHIQHIVKK